MTNVVYKVSFVTICLVLLLATPLSREVFAQSGTSTPVEAMASTTVATTTETIVLEAEAQSPWFKTERIFGKIDVGDFVVGPGKEELELRPGETKVIEITVTNRISDDRKFLLTVEDVTGTADGSEAVVLTGEERGPYSIRDYVSFPEDSFVLSLGERARIPVTISLPPDAEPGGYYGSILVSTIETGDTTGGAVSRSPIIARIGSMIFLMVSGDVERGGKTLEVSKIADKWWYERGPIELGILYENTGSVHLNPYGEVSVTNMFGEEVGMVQLEPWFVLPKSLRTREVTWDREFLLGRYKVTAKINRGYDNIVDEVTTTFWVLPWKIVGGTFLVVFIIIFSMRVFFRTFEFKRKGS